MKGSSTTLKAIQQCGHQALVYPTGHADIYLDDVVFFKIRSTLQECRPQAFNNLYLGVLDHNSLFGLKIVADLFAQIVFYVNMGNQSHKDKHLPPCATATYQPIQPMMDEEYNKRYMVAITHNSPTPTSVTTPVRIDNSSPLDSWSQGRDSNPEPGSPQAANPMDLGPTHPRFSEIESPQAEAPAKSQIQNNSAGSIMMVP
ncbi:hypothetical protein DSO57_1021653 [Entomophthora muscae]|uniref:Uncharacterized protein n=1 Tax=Entomophthora muscae TaxID=34485 RepID=A0ACC2TQB9_9FUNG|nr:hypothetical protein DSO57_1021653 [Entomophthora muscae]